MHVLWRTGRLAIIAGALLSLVLTAFPAAGASAAPATYEPVTVPRGASMVDDRVCFRETGFCSENAFLDFWETNGGLEILGLPIDQPRRFPDGLIRQFYERAIMEWHPENGPDYQVLLTLLGSDRLGARPERVAPPAPCGDGCAYLAETNHTLRGVFLNFWQTHGGLAVFGFPLTEEFIEINPSDGRPYMVQ